MGNNLEAMSIDPNTSLVLSNKKDALNAIKLLEKQRELDKQKIDKFYKKQIEAIENEMTKLPNY